MKNRLTLKQKTEALLTEARNEVLGYSIQLHDCADEYKHSDRPEAEVSLRQLAAEFVELQKKCDGLLRSLK